MEWAKCAVTKVSSQGRTDIDRWFTVFDADPYSKKLKLLRKNAQRWVPGLSRLCGSYSLLLEREGRRMERNGEQRNPLELIEDELEVIANHLYLRKVSGRDDMKTCGG
jgi:hypothetical protein